MLPLLTPRSAASRPMVTPSRPRTATISMARFRMAARLLSPRCLRRSRRAGSARAPTLPGRSVVIGSHRSAHRPEVQASLRILATARRQWREENRQWCFPSNAIDASVIGARYFFAFRHGDDVTFVVDRPHSALIRGHDDCRLSAVRKRRTAFASPGMGETALVPKRLT